MHLRHIAVIEITTAAVTEFLNKLNCMDIKLFDIQLVDEICFRAKIERTDLPKLQIYAEKYGIALRIIRMQGINDFLRWSFKRAIVCIGLFLWAMLVIYLPTRVLFFRVEGNQSISDLQILEAAHKCGIQFGSSRRYVRSEKVKNALLTELNNLQWAGVNTRGCTAVITVRERERESQNSNAVEIKHIVAGLDGFITDATVRKGTMLCKAGQAVRVGQILISGYTDCGMVIKAGQADGEVNALTRRSISAFAMSEKLKRTEIMKKKVQFRLQIGKNIIKLYKSSGIPDADCVKMYEVIPLRLAGNFVLPVSLHIETQFAYKAEAITCTEDGEYSWMKNSAASLISEAMVAGKILDYVDRLVIEENCCSYVCDYLCEEMIARVCTEEILKHDGK